MGFGAPLTKLEYASFFSAALCHLVVRYSDRVSLTLFDTAVRQFFPPGSTRRHVDQLLTALERNQPGAETRLSTALKRSLPLLPRRSTLIVVSDFFDDAAAIFDALSPYLHRGFRVHLFHVLDPAEAELSAHGMLTFVDMENAARVVAHADLIRARYRTALDDHIRNLRALAVKRGIDYALARTDTHYFTLFDHLAR